MDSAIDLYDYIYKWKDYKGEVTLLREYLHELGYSSGELLELACGTGQYIRYMDKWNCTGVDLCSRSIHHAQKVAPHADFVQANMKSTGLTKQFDVIICLFGGIAYLTIEEIDDALRHWHSLLKDDGILIIEPWLEEDQIHFGVPFLHTYRDDSIAVSRAVVPSKSEQACVLDFFFLLIYNQEILRFTQKDILHLYNTKRLIELFLAHRFHFVQSETGFLEGGELVFFRKNLG